MYYLTLFISFEDSSDKDIFLSILVFKKERNQHMATLLRFVSVFCDS